jgi:ABC-type glycerol-3-phosphate transport system permease component
MRILARWPWLIAHLLLAALCVANIYPFAWMLSTSLKTEAEAKAHPSRLIPAEKWLLAADAATTRARLAAATLDAADRAGLERLLTEEERRVRDSAGRHVAWRMEAGEWARITGQTPEVALPHLRQLTADGWLVSARLQTENWGVVWQSMGFWLRTCSTLVLVLAVVYGVVLASSMMGYCLARVRFPGKPLVVGVVLMAALNVVPSEAAMVPIFLWMRDTGLIGTMWAPALWLIGASASATLLMAGFFLSLPREVEEAALVDGAGPYRTFFCVALPMAQPMVATVALFAFLTAWNDFIIPLLTTIAHPHMQPLAVAVYDFRGARAQSWELVNAAAAIMVLPVILVFIFLQKRIVAAIAAGAVKG